LYSTSAQRSERGYPKGEQKGCTSFPQKKKILVEKISVMRIIKSYVALM
jgi:hypothetical protein